MMSKQIIRPLLPWSIGYLKDNKNAYIVMIIGWLVVLFFQSLVDFLIYKKQFEIGELLTLLGSSAKMLTAIMLFFVLLIVEKINVEEYVDTNLAFFMKLNKQYDDPEEARIDFKIIVTDAKEKTIANTKPLNFALFVILSAILSFIGAFPTRKLEV